MVSARSGRVPGWAVMTDQRSYHLQLVALALMTLVFWTAVITCAVLVLA